MSDVARYLEQVRYTLGILPERSIRDAIDVLLQANQVGQTVFTLGNGGSASTASHFACDLAKGTITLGRPRFRVVALTDNVPLMTAWSNDVAYEDVFAEQMVGLLRPGDVVAAFSGSGNSPNVLRAVESARCLDCTTIGFSGFDGGKLSGMVDVSVHVPCDCMEQVEDVHLTLCHLICTVMRKAFEQDEVLLPLDAFVPQPQQLAKITT